MQGLLGQDRSNLSERSCPEWRPYFALEAIECKAVYDYAIYLKLDCEDKNTRINLSTGIKWKVENHEGYAALNNMNAVSVRFKVNRTIKAVGGPPVEDPDMPREFSIRFMKVDFKISSAQSANKSFFVANQYLQTDRTITLQSLAMNAALSGLIANQRS